MHARHVNSSLRGARFWSLDMPGFGRRMDGLSGRRRSPRQPVILAASAWAIGGSRSVLIGDLSATGARLRGRDLPPSAADVLITVGPIEVFATVNWRADVECGVEFHATLTPDLLGQIQKHGDWALVTGLRHP